MKLARIGSSGETWLPDDMTGAGAAMFPGRWNVAGQMVIYAAPTLAMAVLETVAHVNSKGLPLDRYVIEIDVPAAVWKARRVIKKNALPGGWEAIPHGLASTSTGDAWYKAGNEALLELPSAIIPEETIILINAAHPDSQKIKATSTRLFQYNVVLRP